ncbi:hypothetical protein [Streptomyces tanashiensis]|uniref:hypothetical protein n=1 Tax=Streptomyces tanashiensis TaxID=67367 RepID=UPI001678B5D9|nr:hypothetical protein [Streptomyces tanashiensis]
MWQSAHGVVGLGRQFEQGSSSAGLPQAEQVRVAAVCRRRQAAQVFRLGRGPMVPQTERERHGD